jgi:hypothetical protein
MNCSDWADLVKRIQCKRKHIDWVNRNHRGIFFGPLSPRRTRLLKTRGHRIFLRRP